MQPPFQCNYNDLLSLLKKKRSLSSLQKEQLRFSIDNNHKCWEVWNKVRWDAAIDSKGVKELHEYLGSDFVQYYDSSWALAQEWNTKDRQTKQSVEDFYKNTKNYIYNSVIFYESGDRMSLNSYFRELKRKFEITSVVDYGCGVGNDGLEMLNQDVKVYFIDFESPTLEFLKWRLKHRKINKDNYGVIAVGSKKANNVDAEMFWSIDVIEHMKNPMEIFNFINSSTKVVAYFTDADDTAKGRHPFHFKINTKLLSDELSKRGYIKSRHKILNIWIRKDLAR